MNNGVKLMIGGIIKKNYFWLVILVGFLASFNFVLAENCPTLTTVEGTNVTFVGELTDMGGDSFTYVWFEYGKTTSLGQKTTEKTLTQSGMYCITVSGLSPSTTYYYRAGARNSAGTSYGETKTFTTKNVPLSVDIKANGSDGLIAVSYNSSVSLTWTSSNANSCSASGDWSGSKSLFGSESTGNLLSSKTYTITCSGAAGSASDSVTVNVSSQPVSSKLSVNLFVRNLSDGTNWSDEVYADPGEIISFLIKVTAGNSGASNVTLKNTLPEKIKYRGKLEINGVSSVGDILSGLSIGSFASNQTKTITFEAILSGTDNFGYGETQLINSALVYNVNTSGSDTAKIIVVKKAVAGAATAVPTGLTNNIFFDSFLIPLMITLALIWLFKSRILKFEEWLDKRKKEYQEYRSKKLLQLKIAQIKTQEFFQNKIR